MLSFNICGKVLNVLIIVTNRRSFKLVSILKRIMADAKKTLRELLNFVLNERGFQPREVEVKEISTGGANYTSALFLVYVNSQNKELKLFAKVAKLSQELRELMNADWMFNTERFVYNKIMNVYNDLQDHLNEDDKFIFPKYYGCNAETGKETIVLENLVESGYKSYNRFESMDWDHGKICVENLAKFHALSFALEKRDPQEFKKITDNMVYRLGNNAQNQASIDVWIQMVERSVSVLNEEHRDLVKNMALKPDLLNQYNKPIGKPVLSHGDYRLSNMLFIREGENLKLKVVDYQTVHAGCPVSDLIYFIFLGSDQEFRNLYYDKLLDHYYKSLEQALKKLSVDPIEVYPREKFDSDLKELLPFVLLLCVMVLPVVTVESDLAPQVDTDNADISSFMLNTNELYSKRFKGIVDDFIKWGIISLDSDKY